jgi:hypothetical protein
VRRQRVGHKEIHPHRRAQPEAREGHRASRSGIPSGVGRPVEPRGGVDHIVVQRRRRQRALRRDTQQLTIFDAGVAQCLVWRQRRTTVDTAEHPKSAPLVAVGDVLVAPSVT